MSLVALGVVALGGVIGGDDDRRGGRGGVGRGLTPRGGGGQGHDAEQGGKRVSRQRMVSSVFSHRVAFGQTIRAKISAMTVTPSTRAAAMIMLVPMGPADSG